MENNKFVGPGKVFETEEEEFAEYIEMMEWKTQTSPEEVERFIAAVEGFLDSQSDDTNPSG
jgi:hypothetical protein